MTHRASLPPWLVVGVAAVSSAGILSLLRRRPPGGRARWDRTNHAGAVVSLLEGPAYVLGAGASAVAAGSSTSLAAALGAGAVGALDDLAGDSARKGLAGHLGALREGRVTTGAAKILGLGVTGLAVASSTPPRGRGGRLTGGLDVLVGAAVVAGTANLVNLLDLRPGRALKCTVLAAAPMALGGGRSPAGAAATGAALGLLREDLAGHTMLGDTGANAAGALVGATVLDRFGRRGRTGVLVVVAALTLASERVSFTRVIESTPGLRELDAWGRGPS